MVFIAMLLVMMCLYGINAEALIKAIFGWMIVKVIEFIIIKMLD